LPSGDVRDAGRPGDVMMTTYDDDDDDADDNEEKDAGAHWQQHRQRHHVVATANTHAINNTAISYELDAAAG